MKNFFKKLKRAWKAFFENEKHIPLTQMLDELESEMMQKNPAEVYEMKLKASQAAREAHNLQNKQIDDYFNKILSSHFDPAIIAIYKDDRKPIPFLHTNIHFFMQDKPEMAFGRVITIFIKETKIGEAIFTAKFVDGVATCTVDEKIKCGPVREGTGPWVNEGRSS